MIENELTDGVRSAMKSIVSDADSSRIASAIANKAITDDETGRQLLSLDRASNRLLRFDIPLAVTAAAGILGAGVSILSGSVDVASVLAAIGALGALKGIKEPLPKTSAHLIVCLLPKKVMSRNHLKGCFEKSEGAGNNLAEIDFEQALEKLEQLGSIRIKGDEVHLVERVLVRW